MTYMLGVFCGVMTIRVYGMDRADIEVIHRRFLDIAEDIDGRLVFVSGFPQSLKIGDAQPHECTSRHTIGGCRVFPVL